jgi:hypothetical protein
MAYGSGCMKRTLNSSESLDNLESICESIRVDATTVARYDLYLSKLSGDQRVGRNQNEHRGGIPSVVSH